MGDCPFHIRSLEGLRSISKYVLGCHIPSVDAFFIQLVMSTPDRHAWSKRHDMCVYNLLSNQTSPKWTRAFVIWSWHKPELAEASPLTGCLRFFAAGLTATSSMTLNPLFIHWVTFQGISSTNGSKNGETHHWPVPEIVKRSQMSSVQCPPVFAIPMDDHLQGIGQ